MNPIRGACDSRREKSHFIKVKLGPEHVRRQKRPANLPSMGRAARRRHSDYSLNFTARLVHFAVGQNQDHLPEDYAEASERSVVRFSLNFSPVFCTSR